VAVTATRARLRMPISGGARPELRRAADPQRAS
jgi:hypothetical protein